MNKSFAKQVYKKALKQTFKKKLKKKMIISCQEGKCIKNVGF